VAALVAASLTNGDIATRLIVTRCTVAPHLEHILRKLGLRSRVQIGVWVARWDFARRPV
jgi:DNA-binding NarL/FixJ family response regulator